MTARGDQPEPGGHPVKTAVGVVGGLLSLVGLGALALGRRRAPDAVKRGGYEPRDAPPKLVAGALAGLLSLVGVGALVAWAIASGYQAGQSSPAPTGFDRAAAVPAGPRLEIDQTGDRVRLERQAEAHLTGYGWSDEAAGLARIPIERAMALQAADGWPDAETNAAAAGGRVSAVATSNAAQPAAPGPPQAAPNVAGLQR